MTTNDKLEIEDAMTKEFLDTLYGRVTKEGYAVLAWSPEGKTDDFYISDNWFDMSKEEGRAGLVEDAKKLNASGLVNTFFTVNLRPCPMPGKRGGDNDVAYYVGCHCDYDIGKEGEPQSIEDIKDFISTLPLIPPIAVLSGSGAHTYNPFKTPISKTEKNIKATAKRWGTAIKNMAEEQCGWRPDTAAFDISRLLRLPGTYNMKDPDNQKLVTAHYAGIVQYFPLETIEERIISIVPEVPDEDYDPNWEYDPKKQVADWQKIKQGCGVARICETQAKKLSYPEWYFGALGIAGFCANGDNIAHKISLPYEGYSEQETSKMLKCRREGASAATCKHLETVSLRFGRACEQCEHRENIKTPLTLGMPDKVELAKEKIDYTIEKIKTANNKAEAAKTVFDDPEVIGSLALLETQALPKYAQVKPQLREHGINLTDLQKAITQHKTEKAKERHLHEVKPGERGPTITPLMEDERGYFNQRTKIIEGHEILVREPLSNFTLKKKLVIEMENGDEVIRCEMKINGGEIREVDFHHAAFIRNEKFIEALGTIDVQWQGTNNDIQRLRANLSPQEAPRKKGITSLGFYKADNGANYYIYPHVTVGTEGEVKDGPFLYMPEQEHDMDDILPKKWPTPEKEQEAVEAVYKYLSQLNDANIIGPVIGWIYASKFCTLIRENLDCGGFPILNTSGQKGTGKSTTMQIATRTEGLPDDYKPNPADMTRFTRLSQQAYSSSVPTFLDEFRVGEYTKRGFDVWKHDMRSAWGGETVQRGRANQTIKTYKLKSPPWVSGEDMIPESAMSDRTIFVPLRDEIKEGDPRDDARKALGKAPLQAFIYPYLSWCLRLIKEEKFWPLLERSVRRANAIIDANGVDAPNRVRTNLGIILFGWNLFCQYGKYHGLKPSKLINGSPRTALVQALYQILPGGRRRHDLDDLMKIIAVMIDNRILSYGDQYVTRYIDDAIVIRLPAVLSSARKFIRDTDTNETIFSENHYRELIGEKVELIEKAKKDKDVKVSYIMRTTGAGTFAGKRQLKGVLVDPDILEDELGIDVDLWKKPSKKKEDEEGDENKEGEAENENEKDKSKEDKDEPNDKSMPF